MAIPAAVCLDVKQVVDDVGGRGAERETNKRDNRCENDRFLDTMRKQQGQKDEGVLGPLVDADGLDEGAKAAGAVGKGVLRFEAAGAQGHAQPEVGVGGHGSGGGGKQWQVGPGVADVIEFAGEVAAKTGELIGSGEIRVAIGGEHALEDAQVPGDAAGERGIRAGGEIELAALAALRHQVFEQRAVVGQVLYVQRDPRGDLALEVRLAAEGPERGLQRVERAAADEQKQ
jgi:hypothetical protein